MELGLKGKVAIVTGGTSGIGLAISRRLLAEGTKVFVCGREASRLARRWAASRKTTRSPAPRRMSAIRRTRRGWSAKP